MLTTRSTTKLTLQPEKLILYSVLDTIELALKGYWIISFSSSDAAEFASMFSAAVTTVAKAFWEHNRGENKILTVAKHFLPQSL